jgi:FkbM family methyltransferase
MISIGEFKFFDQIKDKCQVIFDVGCRTDVHYLYAHPNAEYHLFEPNPDFFKEVQSKIPVDAVNVKLNNYGLSNQTCTLTYYENTQSFIKRVTHATSNTSDIKVCKVVKVSDYLKDNNIKSIDFLKIDTEGNEPDILFDSSEFIVRNVKFVQFEYASTWLDRESCSNLSDVMDTFGEYFKFFYVYDERHPICTDHCNTLTEISKSDLEGVDRYVRDAYGFNIVMAKIGQL